MTDRRPSDRRWMHRASRISMSPANTLKTTAAKTRSAQMAMARVAGATAPYRGTTVTARSITAIASRMRRVVRVGRKQHTAASVEAALPLLRRRQWYGISRASSHHVIRTRSTRTPPRAGVLEMTTGKFFSADALPSLDWVATARDLKLALRSLADSLRATR